MTPTPANDNRPKWFDDLLLQYEPFMRKRCNRLAGDADADEIYQEAVIIALRRWHRYKPGVDAGFVAWLGYICREAAAASRRATKKEDHLIFVDDYSASGVPVASTPSHELDIDGDLMLRACTEKQHEAMVLAASGYDYTEIGRLTGLTKQAIQLRVIDARGRIKGKLRQADAVAEIVAMQRDAANDNNRISDAAA